MKDKASSVIVEVDRQQRNERGPYPS